MISYAMRVTKMYSLLGLEMLKVKITLSTLCDNENKLTKSCAEMSAPFIMRAETVSECPFVAAKCKAVFPS